MIGWNALRKQMVKAMKIARADVGVAITKGTGSVVLDVLCLHFANNREQPKKLADICFKLNVENSHIVNSFSENSSK